jgi:hypothetical protein
MVVYPAPYKRGLHERINLPAQTMRFPYRDIYPPRRSDFVACTLGAIDVDRMFAYGA